MNVLTTALPGVLIIEPTVFQDDRGYFYEAWNQRSFSELVKADVTFVQDNESMSKRGVLRGVHYQQPNPQGKLVRTTSGAIWDVAVDLRRSSPSFLSWIGVRLTAENRKQLWVPEGFGHGFVVESETAIVSYKATSFFDGASDRAVRWDDPAMSIEWPISDEITISDKDRNAPLVADAVLFD